MSSSLRDRETVAVGLAVGLAALVVACDMWLLGLPYGEYFADAWVHARFAARIVSTGLLAVLEIFLFWASLRASRRWKIGCWLVFAGVEFLEYSYVQATGRVSSSHDLVVAFRNLSYWSVVVGPAINWRALVPVAAYAAALVFVRPRAGSTRRRVAIGTAAVLLIHSTYAVSGYWRREQNVGEVVTALASVGTLQAFARAATMFGWREVAVALHYEDRHPVTYQAAAVPSTHLVLIIDESIAASHLSLYGYARETTPWLDALRQEGRCAVWPDMASAATYSDGSVLSILTGLVGPPDFQGRPAAVPEMFTAPTIFEFARAMNYQTHLFDAEGWAPRNGLSWDDMHEAGDYQDAGAFGDDIDADVRMARRITALLQSPRGQFIVAMKRGNHYPYVQNYPPGQGAWAPSADRGGSLGDAQVLLNTYDNGIRYTVNRFFHALLHADGSLPRTTVLYTADHGDLLDTADGMTPLARLLTWTTSHVPLVMCGDTRPPVDTGYHASHHNLLPTLLDLMGFPSAGRDPRYGRSLLTAHADDHDSRMVYGWVGKNGRLISRDFDAMPRPQSAPAAKVPRTTGR